MLDLTLLEHLSTWLGTSIHEPGQFFVKVLDHLVLQIFLHLRGRRFECPQLILQSAPILADFSNHQVFEL